MFALTEAGLAICLIFETTANEALNGRAAGVRDAQVAKAACSLVGLDGLPIFFAVDFDATDSEKPVIARYLEGAASVLGYDRTGVYGGYWVVKYMFEHKVCRWFFQTYAWSGGQVHPATHVYQYHNGVNLCGGQVDLCKSLKPQYGQNPPTPKPDFDKKYLMHITYKDNTEHWIQVNGLGLSYYTNSFKRRKYKKYDVVRTKKV